MCAELVPRGEGLEEILFLEAVDGREPVTERAPREAVRHASFLEQRKAWRALHPA